MVRRVVRCPRFDESRVVAREADVELARAVAHRQHGDRLDADLATVSVEAHLDRLPGDVGGHDPAHDDPFADACEQRFAADLLQDQLDLPGDGGGRGAGRRGARAWWRRAFRHRRQRRIAIRQVSAAQSAAGRRIVFMATILRCRAGKSCRRACEQAGAVAAVAISARIAGRRADDQRNRPQPGSSPRGSRRRSSCSASGPASPGRASP